MRWFLLVAAAAVAVAAEVTFLPHLAVAGVRPDVALALALLAALGARRVEPACVAAWTVGFVVDVASGARLGAFSLVYILAGLAAYGLKRVITGETLLGQVLLVGALVLAVNAVEGIAAAAQTRGAEARLVLWQVVGGALYTALVVPVLAVLARPIYARFGRPASR